MLASLTRYFGVQNLELAEEVVQEALYRAMRSWPYQGIPANPAAWITRVARNLALDRLRRDRRLLPADSTDLETLPASPAALDLDDPLGDDQLTLVFLCCHPQLSRWDQIALTLKTAGGFGTSEIARAFLISDETLSQRLLRARHKLRRAQVTFTLPPQDELPERLDAVLDVLYLLFNEGYTAYQGEDLVRQDLCDEAIRLGALLCAHPLGDRPKTQALQALMLLQASRLAARQDAEGNLVPLAVQDRARWDVEAIAGGFAHLELAGRGGELSEYHLQAGIAAVHAASPSDEATDWETILEYYEALLERFPSPVVVLNRAVAVERVHGLLAGIQELEKLQASGELANYPLLPATLGGFYARQGQADKAAACYRKALALASNAVEKRFLRARLTALPES